jgi:hypothetical protein
MKIKKVFYQKNNDDDWNLGVIFECKGDMDNVIISEDGTKIGHASFLNVREVISNPLLVSI